MHDSPKVRVARGAAWLDEVRPEWYNEVAPWKVRVLSITRCPIAQIGGGSFYVGILILPRHPGSDLAYSGFNCHLDSPMSIISENSRLNRAWRKEIRARRRASKAKHKEIDAEAKWLYIDFEVEPAVEVTPEAAMVARELQELHR